MQKTTQDRKILIQASNAFPMDRILARYCREQNISVEAARSHEHELKRYLVLRVLNPNLRFPMASGPVDELWHNFLLFTQEYAEFCKQVGGSFIHHFPGPPYPSESDVAEAQYDFDRFIEVYEQTYNEIPPQQLWPRIGQPGVLWSC